ncbi:hypothetical protein LSH36_831g00000 [Paralvinella palmiformis]|uniref:Uncharacterized protein n=1 Tax=Paralvinella palmiformis TaxID=53620 RepID=A0AAD9IZ37_9ANNE|nr:hypothetical protein LSH36_831g00000 [Paralvinella palmiformis]
MVLNIPQNKDWQRVINAKSTRRQSNQPKTLLTGYTTKMRASCRRLQQLAGRLSWASTQESLSATMLNTPNSVPNIIDW